jgi:hypothetical protein
VKIDQLQTHKSDDFTLPHSILQVLRQIFLASALGYQNSRHGYLSMSRRDDDNKWEFNPFAVSLAHE